MTRPTPRPQWEQEARNRRLAEARIRLTEMTYDRERDGRLLAKIRADRQSVESATQMYENNVNWSDYNNALQATLTGTVYTTMTTGDSITLTYTLTNVTPTLTWTSVTAMPTAVSFTTTTTTCPITYPLLNDQLTLLNTQIPVHLDFQQRVGDEVVEIPYTAMLNDEAWQAWITADVAERDRRQAARDAYQAEQQRIEVARAERLARISEEARIQVEARQAAEARAKALLFGFLTPAQRLSWEEHQFFDKQIGEHTYRFTYGTAGNISRMREGRTIERYCIHPVAPAGGGILPVEDVVLSQFLLLQSNEDEFMRTANISRYAA